MNTKTKGASPSQGTLSRLCRRPEAWTRKVARFQSAVSRFCPKDDTMSWRKNEQINPNIIILNKTPNGGSLGSWVDEERSKLRVIV